MTPQEITALKDELAKVKMVRDVFIESVESMRKERTSLQRQYSKVVDDWERLYNALVQVTLRSADRTSSKEDCGKIALAALR